MLNKYLLVLFVLTTLVCGMAVADSVPLTHTETGQKQTSASHVWHDERGDSSLTDAISAYETRQFQPLETAGSTGLKPGAFWSQFELINTQSEDAQYYIEYIDHQLISLEVWEVDLNTGQHSQVADLSMAKPFSHREVPHHRFVFPISLGAEQSKTYFAKYSSDQMGFVFPSMRIWTSDSFNEQTTKETAIVAFLIGGFFLMAVFALVAGVASNAKTFYAYSIYAFSKITIWAAVYGYMHQYLIPDNFHWSYIWISAACTVYFGIFFARIFLKSRRFTPNLDIVLRLMMANAIFLLVCGLFKLTVPAIISITIAMLMYPVLAFTGIARWRQGSREAGVFCLAWSFLIISLVSQALRDLGLVESTLNNYYWPAYASFFELLTIMAAIGLKVKSLREAKTAAEMRYRQHLEESNTKLERLVDERTQALEQAKRKAELEARTDPLTGLSNRRCFIAQAETRIAMAKRKSVTLCLFLIDLDFFKNINDTFGHNVGDEALKAFANLLKESTRNIDVCGRYGGEEFVVLCDDNSVGAFELAERIRTNTEALVLDTDSGDLRFTISVGLAELDLTESLESLLSKADKAMYRAKESGRNQVVSITRDAATAS